MGIVAAVLLLAAIAGATAVDFTGHTGYLGAVAFSPDGSKVLTGSWDNTAKPWGASTGAIIINNGTAATTTQAVSLGLTWADAGSGVTRMRFSDNGSTWSAWEKPKASRAYTLPAGLGCPTPCACSTPMRPQLLHRVQRLHQGDVTLRSEKAPITPALARQTSGTSRHEKRNPCLRHDWLALPSA